MLKYNEEIGISEYNINSFLKLMQDVVNFMAKCHHHQIYPLDELQDLIEV